MTHSNTPPAPPLNPPSTASPLGVQGWPLPPGLDQAILRVLARHLGRDNPIPRTRLVASLRPFRVSERLVREQIKQLRRAGHLIGSAPGENGGYYLIASPAEFQDFLSSEYQAKINDMCQTVAAMQKAARQVWGPAAHQMKLFG